MQLPTVKLDTTLTDLFKTASPRNAHKRLSFIHGLSHSAIRLSPGVDLNKKFLYQDGSFTKTPIKNGKDISDSELVEFQNEVATKYLTVVPQRDAFITGPSAAVFFATQPDDLAQRAHDESEAASTLAVLPVSQRPQLVIADGSSPSCLSAKSLLGCDLIAGYKISLDSLEDPCTLPLIIEPEKHWNMNSKRALARSGLPTPSTEAIDVEGYPVPIGQCCSLCRAGESRGHGTYRYVPFIPNCCNGPRGQWARQQERRIISAVEARKLPFVVKTQQSLGGGGTWIVSCEQERKQFLQYLVEDGNILKRLLPLITSKNSHLQPGSITLSDFIREPVANYGATFFVTDEGSALFMGVTEQILSEDGKAWAGSVINYESQANLQKKLHKIMEQTAHWLSKEHGYVGPVGIDVLETERGQNKTSFNTLQIVDLNVRVTGSMALPLLMGHFISRGLLFAGLCTISADLGRREFLKQWEPEVMCGELVIISWYESSASASSTGCVVLGAVDEKSLRGTIGRLQDLTEEVTF